MGPNRAAQRHLKPEARQEKRNARRVLQSGAA